MLFLFPVAWPVASVFLGRAARVCFAALGFLAFGYLHLQQPHVSISMQKFLCLIALAIFDATGSSSNTSWVLVLGFIVQGIADTPDGSK